MRLRAIPAKMVQGPADWLSQPSHEPERCRIDLDALIAEKLIRKLALLYSIFFDVIRVRATAMAVFRIDSVAAKMLVFEDSNPHKVTPTPQKEETARSCLLQRARRGRLDLALASPGLAGSTKGGRVRLRQGKIPSLAAAILLSRPCVVQVHPGWTGAGWVLCWLLRGVLQGRGCGESQLLDH
ncbi:hypothetical protein S7711_11172 [Stachybotrys chartarum IBT 7711]|uniref:Uncharacterized protein n=1 Tax=Stachybotrys chartarum (strain CBS 109288 / IBT 7711) TaxID=1280523 RepID=A0A084AN85_STACB|nr:hypothetical protein S7711_11172 [Stachybotrys chartarum IBT 7711]